MSFSLLGNALPLSNIAGQKRSAGHAAGGPEPTQSSAQNHQQTLSNQQVSAQLAQITMSMQMMQAKIDQIIKILNRNAQAGTDMQKLEKMAHALARGGLGRGGL